MGEAPAKAPVQHFRERQWAGLSKKELEEECIMRSLGKKGSKEDLIQKLIIFHQDLKSSGAASSSSAAKSKPAAKADSDEEDDEEDDDEDEDDEDESDEDPIEVSPEEAAKQFEREKLVRKGIRMILKPDGQAPDGFPVAELAERLANINLKGFAPEKMGYKTVDKFLKS